MKSYLFLPRSRTLPLVVKRIGKPFYLLPLLLCFLGCSSRHQSPKEVERLPQLETVLPQFTRLDVVSEFTATVDALEKADLCAQVRGIVNPIGEGIDIGRAVRKGEALLTLAVPDLEADKQHKLVLREQAKKLKKQAELSLEVIAKELVETEAQERRYRAELEYRELQHKRVMELAKRDTVQPQLTEEARALREAASAALTVAQAQIQTKKARLLTAQAEIEVAQGRIDVAEAELARAGAQLDFATIKAPFDGIITKRWVDSGATIKDPGVPLLTVMKTSTVRVILDVSERDVPHINGLGKPNPTMPANPVTLRVPALQDAVFEGRVTLLAGALDPVTRTMRTEVHLENKNGKLRPQMTGTVRLTLARRERVLTVPSSALLRAGNKMEVYYIDNPQGTPPRGVVKRAVVELGLDDGLRVEIRSGLTGQEYVVTKGNGVVRIGEMAIAASARSTVEER